MATVKRVFITRPAHQAVSWRERLAAQAVDTVTIPLLSIEPVEQRELQQKIKQQILRLAEQDSIIFVSQNAVKFAFDWIEQYWPQFPHDVRMLCVGQKTEQVLRQTFESIYAADGNICSVDDASEMTSEALLIESGLFAKSQPAHKKIMIFRGIGGRTTLRDTLRDAGALVEHCELYWRQLPEKAQQEFSCSEVNVENDLVSIFSGETLQNLYQVLVQMSLPDWQQLRLLVPSKRVEQIARDLGFKSVISARNASEISMWQTLDQLISSTE